MTDTRIGRSVSYQTGFAPPKDRGIGRVIEADGKALRVEGFGRDPERVWVTAADAAFLDELDRPQEEKR